MAKKQIKLIDYIKAAYPLMWVNTTERERFIAYLQQEIKEIGGTAYSWDIAKGIMDEQTKQPVTTQGQGEGQDPTKAIRWIESKNKAILVMVNTHRFISGQQGSVKLIQMLLNAQTALKSRGSRIIILSPVIDVPVELEKAVVVYTFELPTVGQLTDIANKLLKDNQIKTTVGDAPIRAKGLTAEQAEDAFSLSLIKTGTLNTGIIEEQKLQNVRKSGLAEIWQPVAISELGGCGSMKKYITDRKVAFTEPEKYPQLKGILMVGLPGCGKSLISKIIASVLELPLVRLNMSSLKSGIVGSSERNMRMATNLIDAISPCIVWMDEIEKAMGGVQSSNRSDAGTTGAMFGHFLTWMQETSSRCYITATCNDIGDLMEISQGALLSRFDDVFFIDLPRVDERKQILDIMNKRYKTSISLDMAIDMDQWSGREIEKFVKASVFESVEVAKANVHPLAIQNPDLEKARQWAFRNARIANDPEEKQAEGRFLS